MYNDPTSPNFNPYQHQPWQASPPPPIQRRRSPIHWYKARSRRGKVGYGCLGIFVCLLLCVACSGIASAVAQSGQTASAPTPTATRSVVQVSQATTSSSTPLAVKPTATPTAKPTPTATPTPKPVVVPTQPPAPAQKPVPTATPQPTCQAVNNNPWCYNFSPGNLIYTPPSGFCGYFNCIPSFYASDDPGDGYIIECQDTTYSQSGGESGACSHHNGELRPLYSH